MIALFRLMRPEQWFLKNVFVFTGYLFSERATGLPIFLEVLYAFMAFCLVSSSVYIGNDIRDVESDRAHPKKRFRPIAAGLVNSSKATVFAICLLIGGVVLGSLVSWKVVLILGAYIVLNILYTLRFKQIVILDVFCIAAGFMLRILAGTLGVDIPPSHWLLLCGLMLTLFLGFTKRRAELKEGKADTTRQVLGHYTPDLLDQLIAITVTGVILSYSLYTMSPDTIRIHGTQNLLFTVPFVIYALFRYLFLLHNGNGGGDAARELIRDPHILVSVACWAVLVFVLIF